MMRFELGWGGAEGVRSGVGEGVQVPIHPDEGGAAVNVLPTATRIPFPHSFCGVHRCSGVGAAEDSLKAEIQSRPCFLTIQPLTAYCLCRLRC